MEPVQTVSMLAQLLEAAKVIYTGYADAAGHVTALCTLIAGHVAALCTFIAAVFLPIKGEQPEKALKGVAAFLEKFSRK